MPELRLLKMFDASGRLVPERVLTSPAPKAVVWAPSQWVAEHVRDELMAAGVDALLAVRFCHVANSLRAGQRPAIAVTVVQLALLGEANEAALAAARWAGCTGPLIGISGARMMKASSRLRLGIEIVSAAPGALAAAVRTALAR